MNKHQYCAIATAILGITASAVLWTNIINSVPMPYVSRAVSESMDTLLTSFFKDYAPRVSVQNLGSHFAETVVVEEAEVVLEQKVVVDEEVVEVVEDEVVPNTMPLHAAAVPPTELEQWELSTAWNISVPSLGIRAPVLLPSMKYWSSQEWGMLEEQMQVGLNHGAVAYPHSTSPGSVGSLIVAGHSSPPDERSSHSAYGHLFATLPNIAVGEEIQIRSGRDIVTYRIEDKTVVSPQHTEILKQQSDDSILKVITCYPVGTTENRMIITGKKVEK